MTGRKLPRPFEMPWGKGQIVEEASVSTEWHEPSLQLLEYEDGSLALRFCSYNHKGQFQRSPLMVGADDLAALGKAVKANPRLRALLKKLTA